MSHEIRKTDGLALAKTPAWHGLGTVLPEAPTVGEAIRVAGLDWTVEQRPLIVSRKQANGWDADTDGPTYEDVPDTLRDEAGEETGYKFADRYLANVRSDTGEILGVVSKDYTPAQNTELGGLIIDAARTQSVKIETAGSLRGGREVFFLAQLGTFEALPGDVSHTYALFHNGHDGTRSLTVAPTDVRVVCRNTRRMALGAAERAKLDFKINLRHTKNLGDQVERIREILVGQAAVLEATETEARALAAREMTEDEVREFFTQVYEFAAGMPKVPTAEATATEVERFERARAKAVRVVGSWFATMEEEGERFSAKPSAWLAYNAASKWSDHNRPARDREHSNLFGTSAKFKGKAYEAALALASQG